MDDFDLYAGLHAAAGPTITKPTPVVVKTVPSAALSSHDSVPGKTLQHNTQAKGAAAAVLAFQDAEVKKLKSTVEDLKCQLEKSKQAQEESEGRATKLEEERQTLVRNISILYRTAVAEVERKAKEIQSLRAQLHGNTTGVPAATPAHQHAATRLTSYQPHVPHRQPSRSPTPTHPPPPPPPPITQPRAAPPPPRPPPGHALPPDNHQNINSTAAAHHGAHGGQHKHHPSTHHDRSPDRKRSRTDAGLDRHGPAPGSMQQGYNNTHGHGSASGSQGRSGDRDQSYVAGRSASNTSLPHHSNQPAKDHGRGSSGDWNRGGHRQGNYTVGHNVRR